MSSPSHSPAPLRIAIYTTTTMEYLISLLQRHYPEIELLYSGPEIAIYENFGDAFQNQHKTNSWVWENLHLTADFALRLYTLPIKLPNALWTASIEPFAHQHPFVARTLRLLLPFIQQYWRIRGIKAHNKARSLNRKPPRLPAATAYRRYALCGCKTAPAPNTLHVPNFLWSTFKNPQWDDCLANNRIIPTSADRKPLIAPLNIGLTTGFSHYINLYAFFWYKKLRRLLRTDVYGPRSFAPQPLPPVEQRTHLALYAQYRFVLCVEPAPTDGIINKTLWWAYAAGAIPLYYGAPDVDTYFNPAAFINLASDNWRVQLQRLLRDPAAYADMQAQPLLTPINRQNLENMQQKTGEFIDDFVKDFQQSQKK